MLQRSAPEFMKYKVSYCHTLIVPTQVQSISTHKSMVDERVGQSWRNPSPPSTTDADTEPWYSAHGTRTLKRNVYKPLLHSATVNDLPENKRAPLIFLQIGDWLHRKDGIIQEDGEKVDAVDMDN